MFCEDLSTVTRNVANRNQRLWSDVSQNLGGDTYTADNATTDAAKAMSSVMATVQDLADLWIRYPERERVAAAATTAFVLVRPQQREDGTYRWTLEDSIWMRLPSSRVEDYEDPAQIEISGPNADIVAALKACLHTELGKSRQAYRLYTRSPRDLSDAVGKADATAFGVYTGSVYITRPTTMLISNLRIVIEPEPKPKV
jgi:hypothetical protein